ncbi:MAG: polysaccharide biosynthesis/export family protein [Phycisphaerae bacterium]
MTRMSALLLSPFRRAIAFVGACIAAALIGCGPKPGELSAFLRAHEQDVSGGGYRVNPPDVLEFTSPTATEIDNESQMVNSDGKVTLRLIGEVSVAGLTTTEISDKIEKQMARYYVAPKVTVRVVSPNSKRYFVFGEVAGPGAYTYTGHDTLLRALALSQPTFLAWNSQVKVIRPSHTSAERHEIVVDVDDVMKRGMLEKNVLLQEGDIVYVPPTPLAWVGLRLRELLYPVGPAAGVVSTPIDFRDQGVRYNQPGVAAASGRSTGF